jgi:hypothetical protein
LQRGSLPLQLCTPKVQIDWIVLTGANCPSSRLIAFALSERLPFPDASNTEVLQLIFFTDNKTAQYSAMASVAGILLPPKLMELIFGHLDD